MLGEGKGQSPEMRILNKVVRWTAGGIELEADPRHAELVIKELGLAGGKSSSVPGAKESAKKMPEDGVDEKRMNSGTKARIELREDDLTGESGRAGSPTDEAPSAETRGRHKNIDSIAEAKKSMGGREWGDAECGIGDEQAADKDEELDKDQAKLYRAVAARLNYIAPDRPDLAYSVKDSARSMSNPKKSDMQKLKNIGRYLIGNPRLVQRFPWQDVQNTVSAFTDSDWAGCSRTARSTSGGAMCIG